MKKINNRSEYYKHYSDTILSAQPIMMKPYKQFICTVCKAKLNGNVELDEHFERKHKGNFPKRSMGVE